MNLVFITGNNPYGSTVFGGAESSCRLIAEQLAQHGHRITYLTEDVSDTERTLARHAGVDLRAFPRRSEDGNWLVARFARLLNERNLRRCVPGRDADLVYCFYEISCLRVARALAQQQRRPARIVLRMAGLHWSERVARSPKLAARFAHWFNTVDSVNFISAALVGMTERKLAEFGMNVAFRHRFVLDIGSSVAVGRSVAYESLPAQPFEIVMATRFSTYQKRQDILLRAAALLPKDATIGITLIGDGTTKPEMQRLAAELGVDDRVTFRPFQSQPVLWDQLLRAHLLCHGVEYEGLGKIISESMALGLPVLASDFEPLRSYITECENGFLVGNDPALWAARISALADDPAARARVSAGAMAYIRKNYDPAENAAAYERHFDEIIRGGLASEAPTTSTD